MIEMPLSQPTLGDVGRPTAAEGNPDAPQGAFAEMLSRNLGQRLVGRHAHSGEEPQQDTSQEETDGSVQFYMGAAVVTPWTVPTLAVPVASPEQLAPPTEQVAAVSPPSARIEAHADPLSPLIQSGVDGEVADAVGRPAAAPTPPPPAVAPAVWAAAARTPVAQPSPDMSTAPSPWQASPQPLVPGVVQSPAVAPNPPAQRVEPGAANPVGQQPGATQTRPASPAPLQPDTAPHGAANLAAIVAQGHRVATNGSIGVNKRPASRPMDPVEATAIAGAGSETHLQSLGDSAPSNPIPAHQTQHAALVNRVLEAVEYQQKQPPPRMIVVDMPELEGLRVMVAVQSDGKVHVTPMAGSAPLHVAQPFVQAVGEALTAEGFDLAAGFNQAKNSDHNEPRERGSLAEQEPTTRRGVRRMRRASGLRL